jgi:hypothetical protein
VYRRGAAADLSELVSHAPDGSSCRCAAGLKDLGFWTAAIDAPSLYGNQNLRHQRDGQPQDPPGAGPLG